MRDFATEFAQQAAADAQGWQGLNQPSRPGPGIQIAPLEMSANAQKVLAQAMGMRSDNWGAALSKLANVWVANRAGEREASEKQSRRQGWGAKLDGGMTQRELAALDPRFIEDKAYQGFLKNTATAPETFENVLNPYGFGGAAQRSSATGKLANYQGAPAAKDAPQRRIVKGPDNLNYYEDNKERVLPNVAAPTPEPTDFEHVRALAGDWDDATKPVRALAQQRDLMQIGLSAAARGDLAAGS